LGVNYGFQDLKSSIENRQMNFNRRAPL